MKVGDMIEFKFNIGGMHYSGSGKIVCINNDTVTLNAGGQDLKILKEHVWKK